MIIVACPPRGTDLAGCGDFGAPRGTRKHRGKDENAAAQSLVLSHIEGRVLKHGWPYKSTSLYRYIEIIDSAGFRHRFHYVDPITPVGCTVTKFQPIGTVQDIAKHYPDSGMANHIHYEIISPSGNYIDPDTYKTP